MNDCARFLLSVLVFYCFWETPFEKGRLARPVRAEIIFVHMKITAVCHHHHDVRVTDISAVRKSPGGVSRGISWKDRTLKPGEYLLLLWFIPSLCVLCQTHSVVIIQCGVSYHTSYVVTPLPQKAPLQNGGQLSAADGLSERRGRGHGRHGDHPDRVRSGGTRWSLRPHEGLWNATATRRLICTR